VADPHRIDLACAHRRDHQSGAAPAHGRDSVWRPPSPRPQRRHDEV